jgi:hypothetical protein
MSYSYIYHKPTSPRKNSITSEDATSISQKISEGDVAAAITTSSKERRDAGGVTMMAPAKAVSKEGKPNPYSEVAKMRARMNAASTAAGSSSSSMARETQRQSSSLVIKIGNSSVPAKVHKTVAMWQKEREEATGLPARPSTGAGRNIAKTGFAKPTQFAMKVTNQSADRENLVPESQLGISVPEVNIPADPNRTPNLRWSSTGGNPPRPVTNCKIVKQCEKCKMLFNLHHACP